MVTDDEFEPMDIDYTDDILGNFSEGENALVDKGELSEKKVLILQITEDGVSVRDRQGQEYTVNVLRLSKM